MFEIYLEENINKLSEDYYGHPQIDPCMLYAFDLGFRNYVRDNYYLEHNLLINA